MPVQNPNTPKRILIATQLHSMGGVETHLRQLCRLLVQHGAEITVVARVARPGVPLIQVQDEIPIRVIATPLSHSYDWPRTNAVLAALLWPLRLHRDFDVLYAVLEFSWLATLLAACVKPQGYVLANPTGTQSFNFIDPAAEDIFDGIIAESSFMADRVRQSYPNAPPVRVFPLLTHPLNPPRRQKRTVTELRVAYIGRYDHLKGIYRLLDLWPDLAIYPARLDFYGSGTEDENLRTAITDRGMSDAVRVNPGFTDPAELTKILGNTDLVVLPSETEGLPVILLESMAYGVPFVATDVGGVRTLAEQNPDVCVVPLDNRALKHAIEETARRIRQAEIQGNRLQDYYQHRYSYERVSTQWLAALLQPEQFWGPRLAPRHRIHPYSVLLRRIRSHMNPTLTQQAGNGISS